MSEPRSFLDGRVVVHAGDCRAVLKTLAENSVDSVVTDPPYHLTSIVKRFGGPNAKPPRSNLERNDDSNLMPSRGGGSSVFKRSASGFMGKQWDGGDIAFQPELWAEVLRCMKPGAHGLSMGGARTFHRLVCAIEDAGAEIRDCLYYCYGSGFPKSHNISLDYEKELCYQTVTNGRTEWRYYSDNALLSTNYRHPNAIEWDGYGTSLKPAVEPICLFRKPLSEPSIAANVLRWGVGAINVAGCRVGTDGGMGNVVGQLDEYQNKEGGWRTKKFVTDDTVRGRWPANMITDGSEEVLACFPEVHAAGHARDGKFGADYDATSYDMSGPREMGRFGDSGSAARFFATFPQEDGREFVRNSTEANEGYNRPGHSMFTDKEFERGSYGGNPSSYFASFPQDANRLIYTSKADADDRLGSKHPTVKPIGLKKYLVRLVTPPGGTCLDHFAGTGTTGEACFREGFRCILIEREAEYIADIERRMSLVMEGPAARAHASMKARGRPRDDGPLFGGSEEAPRQPRPIGCIRNGAEGPFGKDRFDEAVELPLNLTDLKIKVADIALAAGRDIEVRVTDPNDEAAE